MRSSNNVLQYLNNRLLPVRLPSNRCAFHFGASVILNCKAIKIDSSDLQQHLREHLVLRSLLYEVQWPICCCKSTILGLLNNNNI